METILIKSQPVTQKVRNAVTIKTTLYDLMETVIDVAGPYENKLINEVTLNILAKTKPKYGVAGRCSPSEIG